MHGVFRAVPLALGSLFLFPLFGALPAELPAIFAPRATAVDVPPPAPRKRPATSTAISDRSRWLMNAAAVRVLAEAEVFDAPLPVAEPMVETTGGTTVMAPYVVRGLTLSDSQVRPPKLRLMHFDRASGDKHRRLAGGVTAPIYHTFIGNKELHVDFSILNGAGNGLDHQIDFVRVELAFRFKW